MKESQESIHSTKPKARRSEPKHILERKEIVYGILKPEGKKEDMFRCKKPYEKSIDLSSEYVPPNREKIEKIEENKERKCLKPQL